VINVVSKIALPGARIYVNATTNRPFNYRFPCHRERQFLTRVNLEIIYHAYRISWNYIRVWLSHSQTCHFNPIERLRSKTLMKVSHAYKCLSILLHTSPDAVWRDGTGLLTSFNRFQLYPVILIIVKMTRMIGYTLHAPRIMTPCILGCKD